MPRLGNAGAIDEPGWIAAKVITLNAIGLMWQKYPPDQKMDFHGDHGPELSGSWKAMTKANMELIEWAFKECAAHPEYGCKALGK